MVLAARPHDSTQARGALERLCRSYWYPLYAHARRRGHSPHDAQDLVQGFFAHLIERSPFQELSPGKGRFRSFLLASLDHFMAGEWDKQNAAKRGGGKTIVSLDDTRAEQRFDREPATNLPPGLEFDRTWAQAILDGALGALADEQSAAGRADVFARLKPFLIDATGKADYTDAARSLDMLPNTVAVTVRRLRQRYRELVRSKIAETVASPADVDTEMGHLLAAMRG